jgi:hypothetical protein
VSLQPRRSTDNSAYTVKELVLRLDAKLDTYIAAHEARHAADVLASMEARGDPAASAAGRSLVKSIADLTNIVAEHERSIEALERTQQRMYGAIGLIGFLGFATLALVLMRLAGVLP